MTLPVLEVDNLTVKFTLDEGVVTAVEGVSFALEKGKTLGVVGESGSGKSVIGQSILRIVPEPGRIVGGRIMLRTSDVEMDLTKIASKSKEARSIRGKDIAMVFQEPMNSFSPLHTIGAQIVEILRLHTDLTKAECRNRAIEMLRRVGIPLPEHRIDAYPYELSGGMRQRCMIAMALACNPEILIADEPTTALDVSIQAQILDLLRELQDEFGMAMLFISHNLGVIAEISHDVLVVYSGRVMEYAPAATLFARPLHPYTIALLKSVPGIDTPVRSQLATIEGTPPDPFSHITGCPFADRCRECDDAAVCRTRPYSLDRVAENHLVACAQSHSDEEATP